MGFEQLAALRDQLRKQRGEQASPETTDRQVGQDRSERNASPEGAPRKADSRGNKTRQGGAREGGARVGDRRDGAPSRAGRRPGGSQQGSPAHAEGRNADVPRPEGARAEGREGGRRHGGGPNAANAGGQRGQGRGPRGDQPGKPRNEAQRDVDPVVVAISKLQRKFPNAFPKKPAAKLPLKLGVHEELLAQADALGLAKEEVTGAIKTWCQGSRYWACLVEDAPRVDLSGEPAGAVTKAEANRARQLARRQRAELIRSKKRPAGEQAEQADAAASPEAEGPVPPVEQPATSADQATPAADPSVHAVGQPEQPSDGRASQVGSDTPSSDEDYPSASADAAPHAPVADKQPADAQPAEPAADPTTAPDSTGR